MGPLDSVGVLVTRPAHQAHQLCELIERDGGRALCFPVLEILDPVDKDALFALVDRLDEFDIVVFISPNAAYKSLRVIMARRKAWPEGLQLAAIGRTTARELERAGHSVDICPEHRFDSEALLAIDAMQDVAGKRIVIFRGEGGRELLGNTLRERGAHVEYAEAYRRGKPEADVSRLMRYFERGELDVITITSNESLHHLNAMVGKEGRAWLHKMPLVVISERTAVLARELGFENPAWVVEQASDEGLVAALRKFATTRHRA
jgi:Uroporphyrinogen-III synthase